MNKKAKRFLFITGGAICVAILVFALKLLLDLPYRFKLPEMPDLQGSPLPLIEQISKASEKAHKNPSSDNLGLLAMAYHSSSYYDKAAQCYKLAIRKNKSKWIWSYYLGYLNQEMGESNTAIENFRDVIKENPAIYQAWYYVGEGYRNLGSNYKAEVAFQKITNLQEKSGPESTTSRNDYFPLRVYAMFQLSRIYINSSRVELAEETLKQILQFHRSFGPAYRFLGSVYRLKGDSVLSKYNIVRANDLADFTPPIDTLIDKLALLSKSEIYILKQIDLAEKGLYPDWGLVIANNGLKQLPENKYLLSKVIKLYLRLDLGNQALPYLNKHISFYRDDFNEIKEVADILYDKGFISQSLIYYNLSAKLKPNDFEVQSSLALCLWNGGMQQNAISQVKDFLDKNKNNTNALKAGISFFITVGDKEKAVLYLDRLRRYSDSNSDPIVTRFEGMIAENDGRILEAITFYSKSLNSDPANLSTNRYLGNILLKQEMWDKAISHYRKALVYHPNEPEFLERLGTVLVSCPNNKFRDYNAAKEFSERAFIHTGCPTEILISAAKSLSEAYSALGDKRNAYTFMNITISMAKSQNAPKEFIAELEKRLKLFASSN